MTIHNPQAFCASLWDWGWLDACFGSTGIRITDIDGFVERHGNFLLIETKLPNVEIPQGQQIMFDALWQQGVAVLIIWGHPQRPANARLLFQGKIYEYPHASLSQISEIVSRWFAWADKN